MKDRKFIIITGGVLSALGKGIAASSIGAILESRGYTISIQKLDPYINLDPGTLSPIEHGEVYVTEDGAETDLDLGHYERFTTMTASQLNNVTTGQVYLNVINKERRGDYLGKTVQVIPHVTDEIQDRIHDCGLKTDISIIELGGTVGDIEGLPYLEALRQFKRKIGKNNICYIHLTLVPFSKTTGEQKTKPTQTSVKTLRSHGIIPNILLCRSEKPLTSSSKSKISLHCDLDEKYVISAPDVNCIYSVPVTLEEEHIGDRILEIFGMDALKTENTNGAYDPSMIKWKEIIKKDVITKKYNSNKINIAIVGKYVKLRDAYKSLSEALFHAGLYLNLDTNISWIDSEDVKNENYFSTYSTDCILVPGGFGHRGIDGKIVSAYIARTQKIPYLGICLGFQVAVIEFARSVLGYSLADSTEFNDTTPYPVIHLAKTWIDSEGKLQERNKFSSKGGTMRLGGYSCIIKSNTIASDIYKTNLIHERHRHRFEFNNDFKDIFNKTGFIISGINPSGNHVEIIELANHPWYFCCQFHPEFKSTPFAPNPLFISFLQNAYNIKYGVKND